MKPTTVWKGIKPTTACVILVVFIVAVYWYLARFGAKKALASLLVGDVLILIWAAKAAAAVAIFNFIDKYYIRRIKQ